MLQDVARVWPAPSQHLKTRSNNVAKCCVEMLRVFGRAFSLHTQFEIATKILQIMRRLSLYTSQVPRTSHDYAGNFGRMRRLGVLPLDGMQVHYNLCPSNLSGFPDSSPKPTNISGRRERHCESKVS